MQGLSMLTRTDHSNRFRKSIFRRLKRQRILLFMILPAFALTLVFSYVPLSGWVIAFRKFQIGSSMFSGAWTGLLQFRRFFMESDDYIFLIRNTLVMNLATVVQNIVVAVIFAVLLSELRTKFISKAVQTVTFFPYFISWVITYSVIWSLMAVRSGAINQFMVGAGIIQKGINILGEAKYAWPLIIYLGLWKYTGYNSIIFLATISGIPHEEYEAASIDGAGRFRRIWYITIRNLVPTVVILVIMNSGMILNSSLDQYFIFTNGTNWQRMEVLDMYIYNYGLRLLDYSYATAVGIMKTIISLLMLYGVNMLSKKISKSSIF